MKTPIERRVYLVVRRLMDGGEVEMPIRKDGPLDTVRIAENNELCIKMIKRISRSDADEVVWMGLPDVSFGQMLRILERMPEEKFVEMAANNVLQDLRRSRWR